MSYCHCEESRYYRDDVAIRKIYRDYHAEFTLNTVNVLVMARDTDYFAFMFSQ